ncbi:MAG: hypothetical protein KDI92_09490 [Xanthomonadales bacterium]|nr:hypothetical protein [Xanthomonadales bacterium]
MLKKLITLPFWIILLINSQPLLAQATYSYTGPVFDYADPPYTNSNQIVGNFVLPQALDPFLVNADISTELIDFSFSDGVQTRSVNTTTVCTFNVTTNAVGELLSVTINLREAPTPAVGQSQQVLDIGANVNLVGSGPANTDPCSTIVLDLYAESYNPGIWQSDVVVTPVTTRYDFLGAPFTTADLPYSVGDSVNGYIELDGPLLPFMINQNIEPAITDFRFSDGIQNRSPNNTFVCGFTVSTDAVGNIIDWVVNLREIPLPNFGDPQQALDLTSSMDQVGSGPAGFYECAPFSLSVVASSHVSGTWSMYAMNNPTSYNYTGSELTTQVGTYQQQTDNRLLGSISLNGPIPPSVNNLDISLALTDLTFTDSIQTRTLGNSVICEFSVSTNVQGEIIDWTILLREDPLPAANDPQQSIDSNSSLDQVGFGTVGATSCDTLVLSDYASNQLPGTWGIVPNEPPTPVPAISTWFLLLMTISIFLACLRQMISRSYVKNDG